MDVNLDAIDWAELIRPGDLVVWGQASAEPTSLTAALTANRARIGQFRAFIGMGFGNIPDPVQTDRIAFSSYCGSAQNRRLGDLLDIVPIHYSAFAPTLAAQRPIVLISLAAGSDRDHFSYGASGDYIADLLPSASLVIAEVSSQTPSTGSGRDVPRHAIDYIVHSDAAPLEPAPIRIGPTELAIAKHVAALIEDGSVIQAGIGNLPSAVLGALGGHRDLGIHSGLIGDEIVDLVEAGVVTNAHKTIDPGVTVTGLLSGGSRLMQWADNNPLLAVRPTSYTHDPAVLASIDKLVAVNSAIEVDLTGQINAEIANGRYLGAIGGAAAFLRGAGASRGGLPIIALPSTVGSVSRIVTALSGPTSTARSDVGLIVTEHGVADLRGLSLRQRREALLAIAHPDHRAALDRDSAFQISV